MQQSQQYNKIFVTSNASIEHTGKVIPGTLDQDVGPLGEFQDPRTLKWDRGYENSGAWKPGNLILFDYKEQQLSCHIYTTIFALVHCIEHKAEIIFQAKTPFGQSLVFKSLTLKRATAKLQFSKYDIRIIIFSTFMYLPLH